MWHCYFDSVVCLRLYGIDTVSFVLWRRHCHTDTWRCDTMMSDIMMLTQWSLTLYGVDTLVSHTIWYWHRDVGTMTLTLWYWHITVWHHDVWHHDVDTVRSVIIRCSHSMILTPWRWYYDVDTVILTPWWCDTAMSDTIMSETVVSETTMSDTVSSRMSARWATMIPALCSAPVQPLHQHQHQPLTTAVSP